MTSYLFVLGSASNLAFTEAKNILSENNCQLLSDNLLIVNSLTELDIDKYIKRLGGTVKIGIIEDSFKDQNLLSEKILSLLLKLNNGKRIIYGLSDYGLENISISGICRDLKSKFTDLNIKSRFVLPEKKVLSSVQIAKMGITEIIIAETEGKIILSRTLAVQNFTSWNKRDYGRPFADPKSGMLPPKVARMMINIALEKDQSSATVLDPFSGMGTIGSEALMLGLKVIASDLKASCCEKTKANLDWLIKTFNLPENNFQVINSDAKDISQKLDPQSIDFIVTEPYLGPAVEIVNGIIMTDQKPLTADTIQNILSGLESFYLSCFTGWQKILKPGGKIVIVLPQYCLGEKSFSMKNLIDSCEKLGYNVLGGPYDYSHPQAIIRRQIYLFQKK